MSDDPRLTREIALYKTRKASLMHDEWLSEADAELRLGLAGWRDPARWPSMMDEEPAALLSVAEEQLAFERRQAEQREWQKRELLRNGYPKWLVKWRLSPRRRTRLANPATGISIAVGIWTLLYWFGDLLAAPLP